MREQKCRRSHGNENVLSVFTPRTIGQPLHDGMCHRVCLYANTRVCDHGPHQIDNNNQVRTEFLAPLRPILHIRVVVLMYMHGSFRVTGFIIQNASLATIDRVANFCLCHQPTVYVDVDDERPYPWGCVYIYRDWKETA